MFTDSVQIGEASSGNWQTMLAIISALTAFVSAFVGPLIALRIAKVQIAKAEHKERIQQLQSDIATFLAKYKRLISELQSRKNAKILNYTEKAETLNQARYSILLQMNSESPAHQRLVDEMKNCAKTFGDREPIDVLKKGVHAVVSAGRGVIEEERKKL